MDGIALKELKSETRRTVSELRKTLLEVDRVLKSQMACDAILKNINFQKGDRVALFLPIRSEIDASLLAKPLRDKGVTLALPATIGRTGMVFREWNNDAELVDVGFGTRGPGAHVHEVVPDYLIMPLLAFDADCNRLGYGAGHYDRYISERILEGKRPHLIGIAFAIQQLDKVPVGRYDLPLDMIVTEAGVITPKE